MIPDKRKKFISSYSRRGTRPMTQRRKELFEDLLPKIRIELPKTKINLQELFTEKPASVCMEVGFGGGEHLAKQAEMHPKMGFIGCEVFQNGTSSLLRYIDEKKLNNIRVFLDDARLLFDYLPDHCLDKMFILFPDPWPKRKHHKRRLISAEIIKTLSRLIKSGGILRIATDHMPYARWILVQILDNKDFQFAANSFRDWQFPPKDHFTTRYEQKRKTGDTPVFLDFYRL